MLTACFSIPHFGWRHAARCREQDWTDDEGELAKMNEHILYNFEKFVQLSPNAERAEKGQEAQVPQKSPAQSKMALLKSPNQSKRVLVNSHTQNKRALAKSRTHLQRHLAACALYQVAARVLESYHPTRRAPTNLEEVRRTSAGGGCGGRESRGTSCAGKGWEGSRED